MIGMFDGVHIGHRFLFDQLFDICGERGLRPVVISFANHPLNTINPSIAPRLLSSPHEKQQLLETEGFSPVNIHLLQFDEKMRRLTARRFMQLLRDEYGISLILRGFNNRFGTERDLTPADYQRIGREENVEVIDAEGYCHVIENQELTPSSSEIRRRLCEGDIPTATTLLGHPYTIMGTVEKGKQLGRTIGFPTANINPHFNQKLIPADGAYVARGFIPEGDPMGYPVMMNIGTNPTVEGNAGTPVAAEPKRTIEAHFLDFEGDLYGKEVRLDLLHYLRPEVRFPSIDSLRHQLEADCEATRAFFGASSIHKDEIDR